MIRTPTLETPRLLLVPLAPAHADAVYAIYREPAVRRFLVTRPATRAEFDRVFEHALQFRDTHGMWAVIERASASLVGRVGFFAFGEAARPELAVLLSERSWCRGLATEAASACVAFGFAERGWPEIVAVVRPANAAALRVLAKVGMRLEQEIVLGSEPVEIHRIGSGERRPVADERAP